MVGRLHEGIQHLGQGHLIGQQTKEGEEDDEEDNGLKATLGSETQRPFQFLFNFLEEFFHPVVIVEGVALDGVVFCFCHSGLVFLDVEQVDFPSEAEVGLEFADTVYAGV